MNNFEMPKQTNEAEIIKTHEPGQDGSIQQIIAQINQRYGFDKFTQNEQDHFNDWRGLIPENSLEKPLFLKKIEELYICLPLVGNHTKEKINLFFTKENFSEQDLIKVFKHFALQRPNFEISIVKHSDQVISLAVGAKMNNNSTLREGEYFGHFHPESPLTEDLNLPLCLRAGLIPSSGDLKGFFKYPKTIQQGTRIFSERGYVLIKPIKELSQADNLEDVAPEYLRFRDKFFSLFLDQDNFNWQSDQEVVDYFKKEFSLKLEFHYNQENN